MHRKKIFFLLTLAASSVMMLHSCVKTKSSTDNPPTTVYNPSIILGSDNYSIIAIDPASGSQNWSFGVSGPVQASPIVYFDKVYVEATNGDTVYKVDARTGSLVTKFSIHPGALWGVIATPIAEGNMLYVAGMSDTLYAVDTGSGKVYWTYGADGSLQSSPTYSEGNIYFASMNGTVYCVNALTGVLVWSYALGGPAHGFFSSPSICYPNLYIGSLDSNLYSFSLNPSALPAGTLNHIFKTGGPIYSSPTAFAGRVLVGSMDNNLYCVDTQTFAQDWAYPTNNYINSSPVFSEMQQVIYFADYNYNLYCVNIGSGTTKWIFQSTGLINSSPLVYGPYVYIGSYDKNLYAVDTLTGAPVWHYNINGTIQYCSPAIENFSGTQINSGISGYTN